MVLWGFTNTARIVKKRTLEPIDEDYEPEGPARISRRCSGSSSSAATSHALFPNDKCIFLWERSKKQRNHMEELVKCVTESSESTMKKMILTLLAKYRMLI